MINYIRKVMGNTGQHKKPEVKRGQKARTNYKIKK